jgi:hypothetical protein
MNSLLIIYSGRVAALESQRDGRHGGTGLLNLDDKTIQFVTGEK